MYRIPVEERLRMAGNGKGGWPDAAWLYLDSYFRALAGMSGSQCYQEFYDNAAERGTYGDINSMFVAQIAAEALDGVYQPEECREALYQIFIKPFADEKIFRTGGKKK